ncbi:MAG: hypothetical protein WBF84_12715 [Castellaniella sp.]|uniref:hypothetical protein n=1 Tax=Castellaniella sp. TaxID=1955812 RepID=UPI003C70C910
MSAEQTIHPEIEILARVALKDTPTMVTVLHEIHRSIANHDEGQVARVLAAFAGELVGAFREATMIIDELQKDRAALLELVADTDAGPSKRRTTRTRK